MEEKNRHTRRFFFFFFEKEEGEMLERECNNKMK